MLRYKGSKSDGTAYLNSLSRFAILALELVGSSRALLKRCDRADLRSSSCWIRLETMDGRYLDTFEEFLQLFPLVWR